MKPTYLTKKILIYLSIFTLFIFLAFIYVLWLGRQEGYEELTKYLWALVPMFILVGLGMGAELLLEPYWKGWSGENKVQRILKKNNIEYQRDIETEYGKYTFDYDFIVYLKDEVLIIEVKDYARIEGYQVAKILTTTKNRAEMYKKESFAKSRNVTALVVLTDAYPKGYENDQVMDLEAFKSYICKYSID